MTKSELFEALKAAKKRNPDAWQIIGMISGLGESRISAIANGEADPKAGELIVLSAYADARL